MTRIRKTLRWLAGIALAGTLLAGHAETIQEVNLTQQGSDAVARISFNATVRFLQQSPTSPSQLYRITFDLVAAEDSVTRQTTEETRLIVAAGVVPETTIRYTPTIGTAGLGGRTKQLTLQLRSSAVVQVRQGPSTRTIDIVFVGAGNIRPATAIPLTPASEKRFAVTLQSVPAAEADKVAPIPSRLQSFEAFSTDSVKNGVAMVDVNVGYFATEQEAEAVRKSVLDRFPQATVLDLAARREEALKSASAAQIPPPPAPVEPAASAVPAPAVPAATVTPSIIPAATPEVEARASDLMNRARTALAAKKLEEAINNLNQLLLLPPNTSSQEAQELIGVAWERAGDPRRARVEYELYLKLFPEGEGAQRVAQRLASLEGAPAAGTQPLAEAGAPAQAPPKKFTGSIAQYYNGGKSRSQSLVNLPAGIDQSTLSKTTESAIVTSVDLGGRFVTPESETRVVLRGTGSTNLSSNSHNSSLLNAAYVDYKRNASGLAVRVGRQSAISGGLLGLFDGVSLTYPIRQGLKIDLMGGAPAHVLVSAPSERLLAAVIEADGILEHWGGNLYVMQQTTEGIANRRAVGAEVRYSAERGSGYALVDYDTLFRAINAVSLQGSFQAPGQTTITVLVDSRKAPSLQMTNALISSGFTSLNTMLQMKTLDEVRDAARATTAQAKQGLISVSRPLTEKWQLAADLRYSAIGALPAVGDFEATPATGAQYGVTLQFTGSNLYSSRDINNFNLSVLKTPFFKGVQFGYNNLTGLRNNDLTLEPSIRLYTQSDNQDVKVFRVTPGFRASYRLSRRASILGETIFEHSKTTGPTNHDTTNSIFFYVGYRYELF